jgi:transcriptional regulator NrdR family protein
MVPVTVHGITCPRCGDGHTRVTDSRPHQHDAIRRRRACLRCDHRFTTYERITIAIPTVHAISARLDAIGRAIRELQIVFGAVKEEANRADE